jgi:hypothetical protein
MKTMLALAILLLGSAAAHAKDQREDCNRKASGSTGEDRSRIIATCVRRNATLSVMPPRLARMTECNQLAGNMTGQPRVKFVNDCMDEP